MEQQTHIETIERNIQGRSREKHNKSYSIRLKIYMKKKQFFDGKKYILVITKVN